MPPASIGPWFVKQHRPRAGFRLFSIFVGTINALAHIGMPGKQGFNFTQLDALAADFHLVVHAADKFNLAVGPPAHEVAGFVKARVRFRS